LNTSPPPESDQELGLSGARFSLLATLRYDGPQRIGELARREGVSQPTITQCVRGLEAAGLVVRRCHPNDGRGSVVELAPAGRALVRRARARKIAWVADALGDLTDSQLAAVARAAVALDDRARSRFYEPSKLADIRPKTVP
jgi:DNA-binding MarR family transcriptional regulator